MPWKYGFKSIKSIVRIRFVDKDAEDGLERGHAERVRLLLERQSRGRSPALDARRVSGASASSSRRPTLMFNGYGDQVASLYAGMDLKKYY